MNSKVLLLADDLTGACDAAVHFAMRGLRSAAAVSLEHVRGDMPVWAVNTETRDGGRDEIRRLMARAGDRLPAGPETIIFKKIDSTLRGNAGIETAAALEAFGCELAIFTPALPALGRTVESGILRVAGRPEFQPVDVAAWLGEQAGASAPIATKDAKCDGDLDSIVAEGLASGRRVLWAGSAGLAAALARTIGRPLRSRTRPRGGPALFAIGSDHPVTLEQLEKLSCHSAHRVLRIPRSSLPEDVRRTLAAAPALVLSGGDTASAICRALEAERIELEYEIVPGVPWGVLGGGRAHGTPVATKSGGFGAPDALIRIADFFPCPTT
jgi:uncharacterized protein YgbK (DUF1537 family)